MEKAQSLGTLLTSIPSNIKARQNGSVPRLECRYGNGYYCYCRSIPQSSEARRHNEFRLRPDDGGLQEYVLRYDDQVAPSILIFQLTLVRQEHFVSIIPRSYAMTSQINLQRGVAVGLLAARQTLTGAHPRWDINPVTVATSTHLPPQLLKVGRTGGSIDAFLLWRIEDREESSALSIAGPVGAVPATSMLGLLMHRIFHSVEVLVRSYKILSSLSSMIYLPQLAPLGQCRNDPEEHVGPGGAKRFMSRDFVNDTSDNVYHTASGADIIVPSGAQINQTVWTVVPHNKTLWDYQVENHIDKSESEDENGNGDDDEDEDEDEYEYMLDNFELVPDVIVGKL